VGGRGGLGVADLGGLVRPVSLVSSAVEAMLTLLCVEVVDRARNAGFEGSQSETVLHLGIRHGVHA